MLGYDCHYWAIGGKQLATSNHSLAFHNTRQRDAYVTVEAAATSWLLAMVADSSLAFHSTQQPVHSSDTCVTVEVEVPVTGHFSN